MKERFTSKVAVFLILERENNGKTEVLLQRRYHTGYKDGQYDVACSGHLDPNESLTMAVSREAKEEIGISVDEKELKLVALLHPYQDNYLNVFFTTKSYQGTPQIIEPDKCDDLQWFDIKHLPENTIERNRRVLELMNNGIFYDDGDFSHHKK